MAAFDHSYGPTCKFAQNSVSRDAGSSMSKGEEDMPPLKAQFFYSSPLPIDDPLHVLPNPDSKPTNHPALPFSTYDNNVLEKAWQNLSTDGRTRSGRNKGKTGARTQVQAIRGNQKDARADDVARRDTPAELQEKQAGGTFRKNDPLKHAQTENESSKDASSSQPQVDLSREHPISSQTGRHSQLSKGLVASQSTELIENAESRAPHFAAESSEIDSDSLSSLVDYSDASNVSQADGTHENDSTQRMGSYGYAEMSSNGSYERASTHRAKTSQPEKIGSLTIDTGINIPAAASAPYGSSPATANTTGNPFLRAHAFRSPDIRDSDRCQDEDRTSSYPVRRLRADTASSMKESVNSPGCQASRSRKNYAEVPVGVSRLHLVKLPSLQMMPIYWSPLHDICAVTRGTWFYKDTMLPVEPSVANRLEKGYRELRCWSQTWKDELQCALEVGAAGEEKISHRLWPKEVATDGQTESPSNHDVAIDPYCAANCFNGQAAAAGTVDPDQPSEATSMNNIVPKRYPNCHVLYKDAKNAFILKTSQQPSAYYGRKPLAKVMRNMTVGIHVVRGFDWTIWKKLHPTKKTASQKKAQEVGIPQSGTADVAQNVCPACQQHKDRPKVTDLVLVVHGIGQKLSERVESYHFTHAINSFRRAVNVELANTEVQHVFSEDVGGVMVLPVNWRENLSFDEGGPETEGDRAKVDPNSYTLSDITPKSIPAVRGFISDVMLDIPFYMSENKPKMIKAMVREANRIYRLWCKNNPEFHGQGRVHIIAHSLGSVMAMEALSQQPTFVKPKHADWWSSQKIQSKYFDFDVRNLFLVGSPTGFFLFLYKTTLIPRSGRKDTTDDVAGCETPRLGCPAVDNIYNILHCNDPIAYRLNAAVDPAYAKSLKTASVPSSATSLLTSMGKAVSGILPYGKPSADIPVGELPPTKPSLARLPSTVEMDVHDFTREEIAERRFLMLNDNGQIDWVLGSPGGPLDYVNMLGAHSSYWGSGDVVRMLVTEIARRQGRESLLPNMRAVKVVPSRKQEKAAGLV